jgi:hypothetical protein
MISLLRQLIADLLDTVEVWNHFKQKEIGYFLSDSDPPNPLDSSLGAIEKSFQELERLHKKLQNLRKELSEENLQRVSCFIRNSSSKCSHPCRIGVERSCG